MDNLVSIIKQPTVNHDVKQKVLRLVQNWAMAFEQKPTLSYVPTLYKSLKNEGESSALIATSRGRVCVSGCSAATHWQNWRLSGRDTFVAHAARTLLEENRGEALPCAVGLLRVDLRGSSA